MEEPKRITKYALEGDQVHQYVCPKGHTMETIGKNDGTILMTSNYKKVYKTGPMCLVCMGEWHDRMFPTSEVNVTMEDERGSS